MKSRILLLLMSASIGLMISSPRALTAEEKPLPEKPNLLVIIADDMAWNDCGAYDHSKIRTPNIDQLARMGMRFDRAFLTCSSCSPSRCSINTGRYPHATGAPELHMPLPEDQVLFASALREAGYYTAACGKWHMGNPAKEQYDLVREGGHPAGYGHWLTTMRERPKEKPFFFWFATTDPHRPYQKNTISRPHDSEDAIVPPYLPDVPATREDLALYYDEIGRLDKHVGLVMEELEKQGIAENTLVLFLSDNGRPFPRCKTTLYDSGVRTPFLVHWPAAVSRGQVSGSLVSSVDIAPTFCELAGAEVLPSFQGVSFVPVLKDPEQEVRTFVFSEHNWHDYMAFERSARNDRYLYVRNWLPELPQTPPADAVRSPTYMEMIRMERQGNLSEAQRACFQTPVPTEMLFDVKADPHNMHNLAGDPEHQETLREMRRVLENWQQRTDDQFPGSDQLTPDKFHRTEGTRLP